MLLQSNESPRAHIAYTVPDKYRLAQSPLGLTRAPVSPLARTTTNIYFKISRRNILRFVDKLSRQDENPRGFSGLPDSLERDLQDRCLAFVSRTHGRANGKTAEYSRISITLYRNKYFIRTYAIARETERSVYNFVASAPVSRDLPCYSLFYVVRRASPSSPERERENERRGGGR